MTRPTFVQPSQRARHNIFPGVDVFAAAGDAVMLSLAVLEPRAVVEEHEHPHEQVGMVVKGAAEFVVGSERQILTPGDMYFIPGGVRHKVTALDEGCEALDVFHPVREEYL